MKDFKISNTTLELLNAYIDGVSFYEYLTDKGFNKNDVFNERIKGIGSLLDALKAIIADDITDNLTDNRFSNVVEI